MKDITAKMAREIAIGEQSAKVKDLLTKCEQEIYQDASRGNLSTQVVSIYYFSKPVILKTIEILTERGFTIEEYPTAIRINWGE